MMKRLRAVARGAVAVALFAVFGLGAVVITPAVMLLRGHDRRQPVVRAAWRIAVRLFALTGLMRVERTGGDWRVSGSVVVANHPSLIDVVLLVVMLPRTLYVAKRGLKTNPFLAAIVRATALPDDATLPRRAAPYLAAGWNVLIFPEGTRSPAAGGLGPFHRGAAQLALRTGSQVTCVRIDVSRRVLGKNQPPWDVGSETVVYRFRRRDIAAETAPDRGVRAAAVRLTGRIRDALSGADMI
ncbi:MAG: 1-acyl-sn-glycerol-3-phosphate acyltransferase [Kiritimatiellae bacterium]|nr:1-acyl-sn-glycerol-3-phosphate acyltransferase [Kiritimatiellia bacterium]